MSGHSKWATIHRQKEVVDAKRGQAFTKIANMITVAVRTGGGVTDPEANFKLRLAIEKARAVNMPKENIQRALRRAQGREGTEIEEVVYEGYGPGGIAIVVEAATDNKQRTAQEIKNIFERGGGSLSGPGAVGYQFARKGLLTVEKTGNIEEAILNIIDLGADDVEEAQDLIEVYAEPQNLDELRKKLENGGFKVLSFEVVMKPKTTVLVKEPAIASQVLSFMEKLSDHQDVQRVFANFDIPQEIVNQLAR